MVMASMQFDGPVRFIEEGLPGVVLRLSQPNGGGGIVRGAFRDADQFHARLPWSSAALAGVAGHACADQVGP